MTEYKKTPITQRTSYCYSFVDKNHFTISPETLTEKYLEELGIDPKKLHSDEKITYLRQAKEMIASLHRADDRIVDNNLKNWQLPKSMVNQQEKKDWEESHPGEKYTGHWHLRLGGYINDISGETYVEDKSLLQRKAVDSLKTQEPNLIIERLREIVSDFSPEWKELYELVLIQGYFMTRVAAMQNVTESAVRKKVNKIKNRIASDEKINSYF